MDRFVTRNGVAPTKKPKVSKKGTIASYFSSRPKKNSDSGGTATPTGANKRKIDEIAPPTKSEAALVEKKEALTPGSTLETVRNKSGDSEPKKQKVENAPAQKSEKASLFHDLIVRQGLWIFPSDQRCNVEEGRKHSIPRDRPCL